MNKHKAIMEVASKAKMYQTVASALGILDEYNFKSREITEAIKLLKKEVEKLDIEIDNLMDEAVGGELDLEKALEEDKSESETAGEEHLIKDNEISAGHVLADEKACS